MSQPEQVENVAEPEVGQAATENDIKELKKVCVTQKGDKFYYPKTIPRERSTAARNISVFIIILLLLVDLFIHRNSETSVIALYFFGWIWNFLLQVIYRTILAVEEYNHLLSRYEGSFNKLVTYTFSFSPNALVALLMSVIYAVYYYCSNSTLNNHDFNSTRLLLCTISVYLLGNVLRLSSSPLANSLWMDENNGLNYGSGMAYSFFHGYLNLILPSTGTGEKNLKEVMQDYEDQNHVSFSTYKLFILIPKSMTCFVSLKNEYSPSIDESCSLDEKIKTVAGVQNRVYKNAVYKIISANKNKKIYVSAEYATPIKTFKNVYDASGEHTAYYEKHKKDIVLQFYLTLKKVLKNTELEEFCELIYYEDQDSNGRYYDVGKIILSRLKQLKKIDQLKKNK